MIRRGIVGLALAVSGLSTVGCGGSAISQMEVRDDLRIWQEDARGSRRATPAAAPAAPLSIALVATRSVGAQVDRPVKLGDGFVGLEVGPITDPDEPKMDMGFVIRGGGEVAAKMLKLQLDRVAPGAAVRRVDAANAVAASEVAVTLSGIQFVSKGFGQSVHVALSARLPDGRVLTAVGRPALQNTGGHLGWAIPVLVVTGATGLLFVGPTLGAISTGVNEAKYVEALAAACGSLSSQLVQAQGGGQRTASLR